MLGTFFGKTFALPDNIGTVQGRPTFHLSVQHPQNGDFVSLWDTEGSRDRDDVCVELELTEAQLVELAQAYAKTRGPRLREPGK